jgi:hypothetical protein
MADVGTVTGTIGGNTTSLTLPTFAGTPGVPGTGGTGFLDYLGSSTIGNTIGGGLISLGKGLDSPAFNLINGASNLGGSAGDAINSVTSALGGKSGTGTGIDWVGLFLRAVIIILGFIFMAVGLSMFKSPIPLIIGNQTGTIGHSIRKSFKKGA